MSNLISRFGVEPGATMGAVMARHRGMGPGFDFIRIALSTLILYLHCRWLVGAMALDAVAATAQAAPKALTVIGAAPVRQFNWFQPIHGLLVPMFFAVSGFLVTGSAVRLRSTPVFLWFRVLRLLPALATEVTLSALILGPALTAVSLSAYFRDPTFRQYFLNIVGDVHFLLPGLFKDNPVEVVNVNLWTLPSEFYCYLFTTIGMLTTIIYRPRAFCIAAGILTVFLIPLNIITGIGNDGLFRLIYYFFVGVAFFHLREHIPVRLGYVIAAGVLAYALEASGWGKLIAPVFVCYTILFVGMLQIPRIPIMQRGDYSYGIYLYGFPLSQAVMTLIPTLRGHSNILFFIAFPTTLLFAVASWHLIEKPALRAKKAFSRRTIPVEPSERIAEVRA